MLAQPPSRGLFRNLVRTISKWGDLDDAPLEYASSIISRWPESVHRPMPSKWVEQATRGRAPRASILCAHLDLSSRYLSSHVATTLANQSALRTLSSLKLRGDESALRAFFARAELRSLRRLEFDGALTDATLRDLCASPVSRGLRVLIVGHGNLSANSAATLASSHVAPTLGTLALTRNPIEDDGVAALLEDDALPNLTQLYLPDCGLTLDAIHVLGRAPTRDRLTHLALDSNVLGPGFMHALLADDARVELPLVMLSLNDVALGDDGMLALIEAASARGSTSYGRSLALRALEELNVSHNGITNEGTLHMGSSSVFSALRRLDMRWNRLTDWGVDPMARRASWMALERAEFEGNDVRYERLQGLAFKRP